MEHLQYPVGRFSFDESLVTVHLSDWIHTISSFPATLKEVLTNMSEEQLDTPYRPDGWTGRQVIHHMSDSHSHALIRFKWSLSEDKPTIKPYLENEYAQLSDYKMPLEASLSILDGVHAKWSYIMNTMTEEDWNKGYFHPQTNSFFTLKNAAALYDWHIRHHLGHLLICSEK